MMYLDENIAEHPKFVELHPEAAWLWVRLLGYCRRNKTDGRIPKTVPSREHHGSKKLATLIDQLTNSPPSRPDLGPLLHRTEHGYELHQYLVWNKSKAAIEADVERKREAGRKGGHAKAEANGWQDASDLPEDNPGPRAPDLPIPDPRSTNSDLDHSRSEIQPSLFSDPGGLAPPGEDPDALPEPPRIAKPPKASKADLKFGDLTPAEQALSRAIGEHPNVSRITQNPNTTARALVRASPLVQDRPTRIAEAELWLVTHPEKPRSKGGAFLAQWFGRAQKSAERDQSFRGGGSSYVAPQRPPPDTRPEPTPEENLARERAYSERILNAPEGEGIKW